MKALALATTQRSKHASLLQRLMQNESLNFALTNRIPRAFLTRMMGRYSKIRSPVLTRLSIAIWQRFSPLDLSEAKEQHFDSLHACFTRELKPGARVVDDDPEVVASPCDAYVVGCGEITHGLLVQAKGQTYALHDLLGPTVSADPFLGGTYVTLRLTSTMYHRFHAPVDGALEHVTYIAGDVWNVNPPALARIPRLYCQNERAVLRMRLEDGTPFVLVPVAAVLVASIRLHAADVLLHLKHPGPNEIPCQSRFKKGEELGWFEHGSTIIAVFPQGFSPAEGIKLGEQIQMGQALLRFGQERDIPRA
jgi:phosphatidylserine decarboxylase